jgi:hypothetical protein
MPRDYVLHWFAHAELLESLLPDFVLAFTLFTALIYAVLGRRFDRHRRPVAAISVALGTALAVGLVRWESDHDLSIRNLGPLAIALIIIVLILTVYLALNQLGGAITGAAFALIAGVLIAGMLGLLTLFSSETVLAVLVLALIAGTLQLVLRHHQGRAHVGQLPALPRTEVVGFKRDAADLRQDRRMSKRLWHGLRIARRSAGLQENRPEARSDILLQIRRMIPAEGWLTERMARLRERAHHTRTGHVARLAETVHVYRKLPPSARKRAAADLIERYRKLVGLDERLERLDRSVADTERRIKDLTRKAEQVIAQYEFQRVDDLLKEAEKLQDHNTRLCRLISRTEEKLIKVAKQAVKMAAEVNDA